MHLCALLELAVHIPMLATTGILKTELLNDLSYLYHNENLSGKQLQAHNNYVQTENIATFPNIATCTQSMGIMREGARSEGVLPHYR